MEVLQKQKIKEIQKNKINIRKNMKKEKKKWIEHVKDYIIFVVNHQKYLKRAQT